MMTITPTRRPWLTASRLSFAVVLLSVSSSAVLLLTGIDATALACVASVQ